MYLFIFFFMSKWLLPDQLRRENSINIMNYIIWSITITIISIIICFFYIGRIITRIIKMNQII
jgi:hypothetical protein